MITPSMQPALADLKLDFLLIVYRGKTRYALSDHIEVLPLKECIATLRGMK